MAASIMQLTESEEKRFTGLEEGIVPRPDFDLGEERRLLYVE